MDTLSGKKLSIIWETIVKTLREYPMTLEILPQNTQSLMSALSKTVSKEYPMNIEKHLSCLVCRRRYLTLLKSV